MAADPADGGPGGSAAIAAAREAGSRPAQTRRRYFLMFLACCLVLCCCIVAAVIAVGAAPRNPTLAAWVGGTIGVAGTASLCGAIIFLVAFVKALSQRRRRRVRQVAWALVPIVSFSFLAWWPFLVLALVRLRARDWAVFAAYLAAVAAEIGVAILSAQGIIPARAQIITFSTTVVLVAVTAGIHTLVAFRPAAGVPSFATAAQARADAEQARAAARLQQHLMDASGTIPAGSFARSAMIFITVASCGIAIALPARFHWAHLPVRAVAAYLVLVAAALIWGCFRSWRMTLQINDRGVTVRNFFRTRRIDWQEVSGFGSDPDMEGISTLNVMLHDGRIVTATATLKAPPGMLAAIRQEAGRRGMQANPADQRSAHRRRRPRPKWQKWYLLWWLAMVIALTVMGGGNGMV